MSDFLRKCQEIEEKLQKMAEKPTPVAKPQPTSKVVVNHLMRRVSEDDRRAQQLAQQLLTKMAGPVRRQPTDQEMFGHLVPTEEQIKAAENQWGNGLNNFFKEVQKPIERVQKADWGRSGPIKEEDLTEEEQRIRKIAVDPRMTGGD